MMNNKSTKSTPTHQQRPRMSTKNTSTWQETNPYLDDR